MHKSKIKLTMTSPDDKYNDKSILGTHISKAKDKSSKIFVIIHHFIRILMFFFIWYSIIMNINYIISIEYNK
jgi:hypothetical protein